MPNESWKQFTLQAIGCRNKFQPLQVIYQFLPQWLQNNPDIIRWHLLFEPSALIRFQALDFYRILDSAQFIADDVGLELIPGDTSGDLNPELTYPGEDYRGEAEFYGEDLWAANCKFMQACGELSIEVAKLDHQKQVFMLRKFLHLYGNIMGLNYLEESSLAQFWSKRSLELFMEHGRS